MNYFSVRRKVEIPVLIEDAAEPSRGQSIGFLQCSRGVELPPGDFKEQGPVGQSERESVTLQIENRVWVFRENASVGLRGGPALLQSFC